MISYNTAVIYCDMKRDEREKTRTVQHLVMSVRKLIAIKTSIVYRYNAKQSYRLIINSVHIDLFFFLMGTFTCYVLALIVYKHYVHFVQQNFISLFVVHVVNFVCGLYLMIKRAKQVYNQLVQNTNNIDGCTKRIIKAGKQYD